MCGGVSQRSGVRGVQGVGWGCVSRGSGGGVGVCLHTNVSCKEILSFPHLPTYKCVYLFDEMEFNALIILRLMREERLITCKGPDRKYFKFVGSKVSVITTPVYASGTKTSHKQYADEHDKRAGISVLDYQ